MLIDSKKFDPKDLTASDGTTGLSGSLLAAFQDHKHRKDVFPRQDMLHESKTWKEYLVGDDYEEHWIHDKPVKKEKGRRKPPRKDSGSDYPL